jgi:hypothetical protein
VVFSTLLPLFPPLSLVGGLLAADASTATASLSLMSRGNAVALRSFPPPPSPSLAEAERSKMLVFVLSACFFPSAIQVLYFSHLPPFLYAVTARYTELSRSIHLS